MNSFNRFTLIGRWRISVKTRWAFFLLSISRSGPFLFSLSAITNERYSLIGVDMRDSLTLNTLLQTVKVDENKPTLLLSEVVLTYMGRSSCNRVIQWILDFFQECVLATYEQVERNDPDRWHCDDSFPLQVLPDDGFGQVMVAHFAKLGSPLKCIHQYPTSESQVQRYTQLVR